MKSAGRKNIGAKGKLTFPMSTLPQDKCLQTLLSILTALTVGTASLYKIQERVESTEGRGTLWFLPASLPTSNTKYIYEVFSLKYSVVWIAVFGWVVVSGFYESFQGDYDYLLFCGGLSLPFLLCPFLLPRSPLETVSGLKFYETYSFRATLYLSIYSHIGNYWYTHYFYTVLGATYTFNGIRLNDVPIALYFATLFYFSSYHAFSNALLRYIEVTFKPTFRRHVLFFALVVTLSFFTAFMETLTISSFPYYTFKDRDYAYTFGSAFYGMYFLFSFPLFYWFDDPEGRSKAGLPRKTLQDTVVEACGCCMLILCSLDAVRLALGLDFCMLTATKATEA